LPNDLAQWPDIAGQFSDTILIGNGASRAVSERFNYPSLLEVARASEVDSPLSDVDTRAFHLVNETNFESVLGALFHAYRLARNAGVADPDELRRQYDRIRTTLIQAIRHVHPEKTEIHGGRLMQVRDSLLAFSEVFTTNYDLLLYWAMASSDGERLDEFADLFRGGSELTFDVLRDNSFPTRTRVLYLHGALHIFELPNGPTVKARYAPGQSLLAQTFKHGDARFPLIVSEGDPRLKLAATTSNDYLNFARSQWIEAVNSSRSLVVFGHSMGPGDAHLVNAMPDRRSDDSAPPVAVALRQESDSPERRAVYTRQLKTSNLVFFDAATHPLGYDATPIALP